MYQATMFFRICLIKIRYNNSSGCIYSVFYLLFQALCCGPMPTNLQRLIACISSILNVLECPICLDTIPPPCYQCDNGHLICIRCKAKSDKCPVCRMRFNKGRSILADHVRNIFRWNRRVKFSYFIDIQYDNGYLLFERRNSRGAQR